MRRFYKARSSQHYAQITQTFRLYHIYLQNFSYSCAFSSEIANINLTFASSCRGFNAACFYQLKRTSYEMTYFSTVTFNTELILYVKNVFDGTGLLRVRFLPLNKRCLHRFHKLQVPR